MKAAFVQVAARTSNGTQDITDAIFNSDVKAAIIWHNFATANNTNTNENAFGIGFAANNSGTTQGSSALNNAVSSSAGWAAERSDASNVLLGCDIVAAINRRASLNSWLSNGIQLNFNDSTDTTARLINCLLLGGDIEAKVVAVTFAAGTTASAAHGLGGTPELLIGLVNDMATNGSFGGVGSICLGFHKPGTTVGASYFSTQVLPTDIAGRVGTGGWVGYDTTITVTTLDGTNIGLTSNVSTSETVRVLAIRGISQPLNVEVGTYSTPTSTGNADVVGSLSYDPQVAFITGSKAEALNLTYLDDRGSSYMVGAIVNNGGTTQQGSVAFQSKDNASPTVVKNYISNTKPLVIQDNTGVPDVEATLNSLTGRVQLNYSNVATAALFGTYLTLRQPSAVTGPRGLQDLDNQVSSVRLGGALQE